MSKKKDGPKIVGPNGKAEEEEKVKATRFEVDIPEGKMGLFIAYDPATSGITVQPIHFALTDRTVLYIMLECARDIAIMNALKARYGLVDPTQTAQVDAARREASRLGLDPSKIGRPT